VIASKQRIAERVLRGIINPVSDARRVYPLVDVLRAIVWYVRSRVLRFALIERDVRLAVGIPKRLGK
jgi:hypothetical protein